MKGENGKKYKKTQSGRIRDGWRLLYYSQPMPLEIIQETDYIGIVIQAEREWEWQERGEELVPISGTRALYRLSLFHRRSEDDYFNIAAGRRWAGRIK